MAASSTWHPSKIEQRAGVRPVLGPNVGVAGDVGGDVDVDASDVAEPAFAHGAQRQLDRRVVAELVAHLNVQIARRGQVHHRPQIGE